MTVIKIGFDKVTALAARDIKYQLSPETFSEFISFQPNIEGFHKGIKERSNFPVNRKILVEEIERQYNVISPTDKQNSHIKALLDENTFTVITAHQPSLFFGPLYFVYKIFSAINLAERLTQELNVKVVPIFIIGSEDHDFDEVNHLNIFGKTIHWNTKQKGAVGRYKLDNIDEAINELKNILGDNQNGNFLIDTLKECLDSSSIYNDFVFKLVNKFFGSYGLIVVNMDNKAFKKEFTPIMHDEIINQTSIGLIRETQEQFKKLGYDEAAHARDINLFYLGNGDRERIIEEEGLYRTIIENTSFTKEEIINELNEHPENFSPNVIMRPIYQETIFPNLAYIGGGAELAYWSERKRQFNHYKVFFPILMRRNSALIISKSNQNILSKLGLDIEHFLNEENKIIDFYLQKNTDFDLNIVEELKHIEKAFNSLKDKAVIADKSLESLVEAEKVKIVKQIEQIESRIKRSLKAKEETAIGQIKNLKSKLFPGNGLQERHDNFMQFYLNQGADFFTILKENLNPLDKDFVILCE